MSSAAAEPCRPRLSSVPERRHVDMSIYYTRPGGDWVSHGLSAPSMEVSRATFNSLFPVGLRQTGADA